MMGDSQIQTEADQLPPAQIPLLNSNSVQNDTAQSRQQQRRRQGQEIRASDDLDDCLEKLESFLSFLGFNQSSWLSCSLSWAAFSVVGVLVPVLVLELSKCDRCEMYQIKNFELDIVASQACLAAVSLFCIAFNLRKYGIKRFLFVDRYGGQMARFSDLYVKQIWGSMRLLIWWVLPCFLLKTAREIIRVLYVHRDSWWISVAILFALILSWTYVSTISLSASILFHLLCNLQVIHFEDYAKLLERESDVLVFIEEHIRLRHHLSKISHRFRMFLLSQFLVVTASQFITLFQTTGYRGMINFINGGDFAPQKFSHRAQGIASLASRWHAVATCTSTDASLRGSNSAGNMEALNQSNSIHLCFSESDLESVDYAASAMPTNTQLASYMTSYHRRQAFVMYLQGNPGGITIFGWTVDRGLINTIFFIELTLITFVLGKTIVFSSS
ncbi:hypothetical protein COLO4_12813 [Corchorus olitorius]|uniref:Uncharacterized protein n=1 Tax=Corchorus olitorius TaxID=93759 RepID=A0A1R3JZD9_9ROSI|nr:hypothetical protein COLO4_12813 [Corchorus olitorius]